MKLIHTADIHIGVENYGKIDPETGLSTRLGDFLRAFDKVVDYALTHEADLFVFAGDAFKTREPTPTQQREFAKRILRLSKAGIPSVLLVGNHDTPNAQGKANSLDIYSVMETPLTTVIRELSKVVVTTKSGEKLQVIGFPWRSRKEHENYREDLGKLIKGLDPSLPAIGLIHASVTGAKYGSEQLVMLGGDMVVDKEPWINPKIAYVAMGHIHQHQIIHRDPPMVYAGSLERVDFGEEKEDKVFMDVDITPVGKSFKAKFQPISTDARKFISFNIDCKSEHPTEEVLEALKSKPTADSVVKINVNLPHDGNIDLDSEKIRTYLKDAFFVAGIHRNVAQVKRERLAENVEQLDPLTALNKYLESKKFNPDRASRLQSLAQKLMGER
jgi:exonuclease SbcD